MPIIDATPSPSAKPAFASKRALLAVVAVIGMTWFMLTGTLHRAPRPDDDAPIASYQSTAAVRSAPAEDGSQGGSESAWAAGETRTFHGYLCTVDCTGHKIGFSLARQRGISNPRECPVAPPSLRSLTEGCWAEAGREGP